LAPVFFSLIFTIKRYLCSLRFSLRKLRNRPASRRVPSPPG